MQVQLTLGDDLVTSVVRPNFALDDSEVTKEVPVSNSRQAWWSS